MAFGHPWIQQQLERDPLKNGSPIFLIMSGDSTEYQRIEVSWNAPRYHDKRLFVDAADQILEKVGL